MALSSQRDDDASRIMRLVSEGERRSARVVPRWRADFVQEWALSVVRHVRRGISNDDHVCAKAWRDAFRALNRMMAGETTGPDHDSRMHPSHGPIHPMLRRRGSRGVLSPAAVARREMLRRRGAEVCRWSS